MGYTGPKVFRVRKTPEEIADEAIELAPQVHPPEAPPKYPVKQWVDDTPKPRAGQNAEIKGKCLHCKARRTVNNKDMAILILQVRLHHGGQVERMCMAFGAVARQIIACAQPDLKCRVAGTWRVSQPNTPYRRWVLFVNSAVFEGGAKSGQRVGLAGVTQASNTPRVTADMLDTNSRPSKNSGRRISKRDLDKICAIFAKEGRQ